MVLLSGAVDQEGLRGFACRNSHERLKPASTAHKTLMMIQREACASLIRPSPHTSRN